MLNYHLMKQTISKNLVKLRGKLRQKEVAAAVGIKLSRYKSYELGNRPIPDEVKEKLVEYYKLKSFDDLMKAVSI